MPRGQTLEERFFYYVQKTTCGCWLWIGSGNQYGYGQLSVGGRNGKRRPAHRLSYELFVGPIPNGLTLDHLCGIPGCVNPEHLEPVTHRENVLRGNTFAAAKVAQTHCIHGHELTEANLYRRKDRPNSRECLTCHKRRSTEQRERRKNAAN